MKVFLYGNTLNNSYNLAKFLRSQGIEAEMFLDNSSDFGQDYPWWEDTNLSESNLPEWIHYYKVKPNFLFPQKELKRMIAHFSNGDVALVCGWGPIIARMANIPYLFYSYGFDLVITSFRENFRRFLYSIAKFKKPYGLRAFFTIRPFQIKALKESPYPIAILMGYQINSYVKKLNKSGQMVKLRLCWDINKYSADVQNSHFEKYRQFDIVFFMVARHSWKAIWEDFKGNDKFLKAFGRFVKEFNPNVKLVLIEKGQDVKHSKKLISDLGISEYVEWIGEMNKDGIRAFNSTPNVVVVDQFWHDHWYKRYPADTPLPSIGFGSASIEALAAARPLITVFLDEQFYDGEYPPILSAFTIEEIYKRLVECLAMTRDERSEMGRRGREFVMKYHHWENNIQKYVEQLEIIVENQRKGIYR